MKFAIRACFAPLTAGSPKRRVLFNMETGGNGNGRVHFSTILEVDEGKFSAVLKKLRRDPYNEERAVLIAAMNTGLHIELQHAMRNDLDQAPFLRPIGRLMQMSAALEATALRIDDPDIPPSPTPTRSLQAA